MWLHFINKPLYASHIRRLELTANRRRSDLGDEFYRCVTSMINLKEVLVMCDMRDDCEFMSAFCGIEFEEIHFSFGACTKVNLTVYFFSKH